MTTSPALLIGLSGVARLAGVQRPVASVWRSRFPHGEGSFPSPIAQKDGRPLFDALDVARWLERTEHGNNPDAVADAAASAAPSGFDITDARHVDAVDALLTLRAATGQGVGDLSVAELDDRARAVDPEDRFLRTELSRVLPGWGAWADVLADAAYSAGAGARTIEANQMATRSAAGSSGPLTDVGDELVAAMAGALLRTGVMTAVLGAGITATLSSRLLSIVGEDAEIAVTESDAGRRIRRRMVCDALLPAPSTTTIEGRRLHVVRMPTELAHDVAAILGQLNDLTLSLRAEDRAVVLAPAAALTDA
jgi:hypothetical protein